MFISLGAGQRLCFSSIFLVAANKLVVVDLWGIWYYLTLLILHKLVAPCYYAADVRSAHAIGHIKYYTKDVWVKGKKVGETDCIVASERRTIL